MQVKMLNRAGNWLIVAGLLVLFVGFLVATESDSVQRCAERRALDRELAETQEQIAALQTILGGGYLTPSERREVERAIAEARYEMDRAEIRARATLPQDRLACLFR